MRIAKTILAAVCLTLSVSALADKYDDTIANFKKAETAKPYFSSAYAYAVFPIIGKGAIGVGGAAGVGRVYERGKYVGSSTMGQVSVGLQLGGQAYSQIVFLRDKSAFDDFTHEGFEFGADASTVAVTLGASAQAGTSGASASASLTAENGKTAAKYYKGMAVLTLAKGGLMYQAAIAGQKYTFKPK
jgi:lipid-binding SYLF domain-containing protein